MTCHFTSTQTDPQARGHEFGRTFSSQIHATIAGYADIFRALSGHAVDFDYWGNLALEEIRHFSPSLHAELCGMAKGAGVPASALGAINARTEILAALQVTTPKECSSLVQLADHGAPAIVQSWDWFARMADAWLVWTIPHANGHVTTTLTEYGILGKLGVSDQGLALLFNILHHARDGQGMGVPVHVLARAVLDESRDMEHALRRLAGARVSASSALTLVASKAGESAAVSVEVYPGGIGYALPDDDGLLVRTNHFLTAAASAEDIGLRQGPDTIVRRDMLLRKLHRADRVNQPVLVKALVSHLLGEGDTCSHPSRDTPAEVAYATLAVVVIDIERGTLLAHRGGACTYPATPQVTTRTMVC